MTIKKIRDLVDGEIVQATYTVVQVDFNKHEPARSSTALKSPWWPIIRNKYIRVSHSAWPELANCEVGATLDVELLAQFVYFGPKKVPIGPIFVRRDLGFEDLPGRDEEEGEVAIGPFADDIGPDGSRRWRLPYHHLQELLNDTEDLRAKAKDAGPDCEFEDACDSVLRRWIHYAPQVQKMLDADRRKKVDSSAPTQS